jgi:hypothetical protein
MSSQRYQHHQVYQKRRHTSRKQINLWLFCGRHQSSQKETDRTHLTVGGDQIEYPGDKSNRTGGLTTAKMLFNSTISMPGANKLIIDIKTFT